MSDLREQFDDLHDLPLEREPRLLQPHLQLRGEVLRRRGDGGLPGLPLQLSDLLGQRSHQLSDVPDQHKKNQIWDFLPLSGQVLRRPVGRHVSAVPLQLRHLHSGLFLRHLLLICQPSKRHNHRLLFMPVYLLLVLSDLLRLPVDLFDLLQQPDLHILQPHPFPNPQLLHQSMRVHEGLLPDQLRNLLSLRLVMRGVHPGRHLHHLQGRSVPLVERCDFYLRLQERVHSQHHFEFVHGLRL